MTFHFLQLSYISYFACCLCHELKQVKINNTVDVVGWKNYAVLLFILHKCNINNRTVFLPNAILYIYF